MKHLETNELIDYLHGELEAIEDSQVHAHLQSCGGCRSEYERESRLSELLKETMREALELPPSVKARIWQRVRTQADPPYIRLLSFFRPMIAVPVAAAVAIAIYFSSPLAHRSPASPTVDASYYFEQHAAEAIGNPLGDRSVTSSVVETSSSGEPQAPTLGGATAAAAALNAVE
jgi:anti-sigma factor RsiW